MTLVPYLENLQNYLNILIIMSFSQPENYVVNTGLYAGAYMGTGMQNQHMAAHRFRAFYFQGQKFYGK